MRPPPARPRALIELAERLVSKEFDPGLLTGSDVDLFRLARARGIHTVEFRPLLADGCLIVDERGFSVQINDPQNSLVSVGFPDETRRLTVKQRFTFAHEIAHTLPYDVTHRPPRPKEPIIRTITEAGKRESDQSLESFCQLVAGLILVPKGAPRRPELLGRLGSVDSLDMALKLASTLRVSPEVMIHRVSSSSLDEGLATDYFALVMVRKVGGEDLIVASIYSPTLKGFADRPRLYSRVATWVRRTKLLRDWGVLKHAEGEWRKRTSEGTLRVIKKSYRGHKDAYFLELKYVFA